MRYNPINNYIMTMGDMLYLLVLSCYSVEIVLSL